MVRKTEKNVIQRFFLRNTVPVLCAVRKMAAECRQVSTSEHEGER
jgi:hypothetical protein